MRTVSSKYLHPKHTLIPNGILHPDLIPSTVANQDQKKYDQLSRSTNDADNNKKKNTDNHDQQEKDQQHFVYPYGCTLYVESPSWPILSSGSLSFPLKRPICAVWEDLAKPNNKNKSDSDSQQRGRLLVVGSTDMFANDWVEKELNLHLFDTFVKFLLHTDENISLSRAGMTASKKNNIEDTRTVPDIEGLAERVKWCLQEHKPLPQDLSSLFRRDVPTFDSSMIPMVIKLYDDLKLKNEPLSLIQPALEVPCPPLHPAVFQPTMIELHSPTLEKFNLDDEFAEPKIRLAQLTNRFTSEKKDTTTTSISSSSSSSHRMMSINARSSTSLGISSNNNYNNEDDLEYYIQEAGSITGLLVGEDEQCMSGKAVLRKLFLQVSTITIYFHMNSSCRSSIHHSLDT